MAKKTERQRTIRDVKRELSRKLLTVTGVSGVGITDAPDGGEQIIVYLAESRPELLALVPAEAEGYRVTSEVIGTITAPPPDELRQTQ